MSRAILVPYDGSHRSEQALECAVALCRDTRARLGLAIIRHHVVVFASPWVCVASPVCERETCNGLLRRLPDDVSVRFLSWPYPAGARDIAEFASRLDCDAVLLPYRGWRARQARRLLSRRGLSVLALDDGVQASRPSKHARWRKSRPADALARALPVALANNASEHLPNP
jgi:nucleotide-binding universal stress UspA family protein